MTRSSATTTSVGGGIDLAIPANATGGIIVVTGGTDLSTGLPNTLVLNAPFDATAIDPFTTFWSASCGSMAA